MNKFQKFMSALKKRLQSKLFWTSLGSAVVLFLQLMGHSDWAKDIPQWVDFILAFGTFAGIWTSHDNSNSSVGGEG